MGQIRALPPALVNQIAAGEVIERPASVVKELLENSLDAGATRIEVTVEGGGEKLIRVKDDGQGIEPDDLPLAVASHATSKLITKEDLFRIATLGFRGEALSSVASVSRLKILSRRVDQDAGHELRVTGGESEPVRPAAAPCGTVIDVADLFFNVPARRAFLKKPRSEVQAVLAEVRRQALCHSGVSFHVEADGKRVLDAPATDEPRERIAQLLGRDLAEDLLALPILKEQAGTLRGYATTVDRSRGDSRQQFFFLNNRAVRDVTLLSAVKQAYSNLLPPRRHPIVLLWLEIPLDAVDVNVHPQKAEVRFRQSRDVFFLVKRALEQTLHQGVLSAQLALPRRGWHPALSMQGSHAAGAHAPAVGLGPGPHLSGPHARHELPPEGDSAGQEGDGQGPGAVPLWQAPLGGAAGGAGAAGPATAAPGLAVGRFMQLHRRYILEETPAGMRLVDPHALHERILYEEILARLQESPLESQRFLFPQVIEVGPVELESLESRNETLTQLGFELLPFGKGALAVHAAPRLLKAERVEDAVRVLLDPEGQPRDPEEEASGLLHDMAASLACRSAVRFGDALPEEQIAELLAKRAHVRRGHCCPHGRPTGLALSLDELDRRFGRQGKG